jgi:hypothetical protein
VARRTLERSEQPAVVSSAGRGRCCTRRRRRPSPTAARPQGRWSPLSRRYAAAGHVCRLRLDNHRAHTCVR